MGTDLFEIQPLQAQLGGLESRIVTGNAILLERFIQQQRFALERGTGFERWGQSGRDEESQTYCDCTQPNQYPLSSKDASNQLKTVLVSPMVGQVSIDRPRR